MMKNAFLEIKNYEQAFDEVLLMPMTLAHRLYLSHQGKSISIANKHEMQAKESTGKRNHKEVATP